MKSYQGFESKHKSVLLDTYFFLITVLNLELAITLKWYGLKQIKLAVDTALTGKDIWSKSWLFATMAKREICLMLQSMKLEDPAQNAQEPLVLEIFQDYVRTPGFTLVQLNTFQKYLLSYYQILHTLMIQKIQDL